MDNAEMVALAMRHVPATAFEGRAEADLAVASMALRVKDQLSRGSLAMRALAAVPIAATVESVELEESSQRLLVTFRPDRRREGYEPKETIRTDRTDGRRGDLVRRLWSGIEGRHVRIYKLTEDSGNPERPKVRVAPFVEVLDGDAL